MAKKVTRALFFLFFVYQGCVVTSSQIQGSGYIIHPGVTLKGGGSVLVRNDFSLPLFHGSEVEIDSTGDSLKLVGRIFKINEAGVNQGIEGLNYYLIEKVPQKIPKNGRVTRKLKLVGKTDGSGGFQLIMKNYNFSLFFVQPNESIGFTFTLY